MMDVEAATCMYVFAAMCRCVYIFVCVYGQYRRSFEAKTANLK